MSTLLADEKRASATAVKSLRGGLHSAISRTTHKRTGDALSIANARSVFRDGRLQRIGIKAPHYIFKQHHGFEGSKKNGVMMRLQATGVINIALQSTNAIEILADEISEIRLSEVTAKINFK